MCSKLYLLVIFGFTVVRADLNNDVKNDDNANCTCVPYYQCSEESDGVITDGEGLLDLRHLDNNGCTGYFDVCCNTTIAPELVFTTAPPTQIDNNYKKLPEISKTCGYLKQMKVPWSGVLLQATSSHEWTHKCGVSFVHQRVAITAAHCMDMQDDIPNNDAANYKIKVGNHLIRVEKIVEHPYYNVGTLQNDIAVLILEENSLLRVGSVCLPPPDVHYDVQQCTVISWPSNGRLRVFQVPLVDHQQCERMLRKTRLGPYFQLHSSFICAGGNVNEDACDGDGGSPLICAIRGQPGRYQQMGIVSWGIGCGERDTPGVYVNTAAFYFWIHDVIHAEIPSFEVDYETGDNGIGFV